MPRNIFSMLTTGVAALTALFATQATAAFDASASNNVVMYWGQGPYQVSLSEACQSPNFDIAIISFVTKFPQKVGEFPGTNFGNACGGYIKYPNGTDSELLGPCTEIQEGINTCKSLGKKVFLSLGGATPYTAPPTTEVANFFAEFLWGAFGPQTGSAPSSWTALGSPRPFGSASVDGFDFDIEHGSEKHTYADVINRLKESDLIGDEEFYISGAPQCVVPDSFLNYTIAAAPFDFLFIQFYNTPLCSARAGVNDIRYGTSDFTFTAWVNWVAQYSANKNAKLYIGLPADATDSSTYQLQPDEARALIRRWKTTYPSVFGGVMLWEYTSNVGSEAVLCGKEYAYYMKAILNGQTYSLTCPSTTAKTSTASSTSSTVYTSPTGISTDWSCGPKNGGSCPSGYCCSQYGYCGVGAAYCGTGCIVGFGQCDSDPQTTTTITTTSTSSKASSTSSSTVKSSSTSQSSSAAPSTTSKSSSAVPSTSSEYSSAVPSTSSEYSSAIPSTTAKTSSSSSTVKPSSSSSSSATSKAPESSSTSEPVPSSSSSSSVYSSSSSSSAVYSSSSSSSAVYSSSSSSSVKPSSSSSSAVYSSSSSSEVYSSPSVYATKDSVPSSSSTTLAPEATTSESSSSICSTSTKEAPSEVPSSYEVSSTAISSYGASSSDVPPYGVPPYGTSYSTPTPAPSSYDAVPTTAPPLYPNSTIPAPTKAPTVTVITTEYVDICPTGLTTVVTVITSTVYPAVTSAPSSSGEIPYGWTTTVTVCTVCGAEPTTVTLTKPIDYAATRTAVASAPAGYPVDASHGNQSNQDSDESVEKADVSTDLAGYGASKETSTFQTAASSPGGGAPYYPIPTSASAPAHGTGKPVNYPTAYGTVFTPPSATITSPAQFTGAASKQGWSLGMGAMVVAAGAMLLN